MKKKTSLLENVEECLIIVGITWLEECDVSFANPPELDLRYVDIFPPKWRLPRPSLGPLGRCTRPLCDARNDSLWDSEHHTWKHKSKTCWSRIKDVSFCQGKINRGISGIPTFILGASIWKKPVKITGSEVLWWNREINTSYLLIKKWSYSISSGETYC